MAPPGQGSFISGHHCFLSGSLSLPWAHLPPAPAAETGHISCLLGTCHRRAQLPSPTQEHIHLRVCDCWCLPTSTHLCMLVALLLLLSRFRHV